MKFQIICKACHIVMRVSESIAASQLHWSCECNWRAGTDYDSTIVPQLRLRYLHGRVILN